ncbi:MAG: DUF898 domain-containing protein [Phyllobacteriaceae bacterium]|jgi:uncharacterized membrane protein YjgN (DUF898 family)|nr:DUF898 domain-containing protein [Phyllobacteriaceae bacterium]
MQDAQPHVPHPPERLNFTYVPRKGLLKLTIVNLLLSIITFSIYRFWAKTNVRKHIWSCVHINGEPLEYTGTGKELFMGALIVFAFLFLPIIIMAAAISLAYGPDSPLLILIQFFVIIVIYVFWGFAVYKARKYQLSRTHWRGIRGTLVGSAMTYSLLYFGSLLAKSMSFGWATPVMNTVLQEQMTNDMRFGDAAFKFKGRAGPLYPTYALCWLLSLGAIIGIFVLGAGAAAGSQAIQDIFSGTGNPTDAETYAGLIAFGLIAFFLLTLLIIPMLWSVYIAKELRTFANYTRFDGVPFSLDASAGSVIWLAVVNILILIFTLGIGWPYINQRTVRFVVDRISLDGLVDIDRIQQSQVPLDKRGEGLADAFDVGGL